jgi:hypothetical protein
MELGKSRTVLARFAMVRGFRNMKAKRPAPAVMASAYRLNINNPIMHLSLSLLTALLVAFSFLIACAAIVVARWVDYWDHFCFFNGMAAAIVVLSWAAIGVGLAAIIQAHGGTPIDWSIAGISVFWALFLIFEP